MFSFFGNSTNSNPEPRSETEALQDAAIRTKEAQNNVQDSEIHNFEIDKKDTDPWSFLENITQRVSELPQSVKNKIHQAGRDFNKVGAIFV